MCDGVLTAVITGSGCGVNFSKKTRSYYNNYKSIVDEIEGMGLRDRNLIYRLLKLDRLTGRGRANTHVRGMPKLFLLKRNSPIRKKMMDYIFKTISNGYRVKAEELKCASGVDVTTWSIDDFKEHYSAESAAYSFAQIRKWRDVPRFVKSPEITNKPLVQRGREVVCDPIYRNILTRMVLAGHGDDEYAAFSIVMKWAVERLERENKEAAI